MGGWFTRAIVSLTALTMLVHAALGCCWHHTHACEKRNCTDQQTSCEHAHGHDSHGHQHDSTGQEAAASQVVTDQADQQSRHVDGSCHERTPCRHSHQCQGGKCDYVIGETAEKIEPPSQSCDILSSCTTKLVRLQQYIGAPDALGPDLHAVGPPLRTHLLLGILLT